MGTETSFISYGARPDDGIKFIADGASSFEKYAHWTEFDSGQAASGCSRLYHPNAVSRIRHFVDRE